MRIFVSLKRSKWQTKFEAPSQIFKVKHPALSKMWVPLTQSVYFHVKTQHRRDMLTRHVRFQHLFSCTSTSKSLQHDGCQWFICILIRTSDINAHIWSSYKDPVVEQECRGNITCKEESVSQSDTTGN